MFSSTLRLYKAYKLHGENYMAEQKKKLQYFCFIADITHRKRNYSSVHLFIEK